MLRRPTRSAWRLVSRAVAASFSPPVSPPPRRQVSRALTVNGTRHVVRHTPGEPLLGVLREQLRLTGAKEACGRGECGACTVLVDGLAVLSCMTMTDRVTGEVRTVEGLASETAEFRRALADTGGFQCGFCTPGQVVQAFAVLRDRASLDEREARRLLSGNICRCTGYTAIIDAVLASAGATAAGTAAPEAER